MRAARGRRSSQDLWPACPPLPSAVNALTWTSSAFLPATGRPLSLRSFWSSSTLSLFSSAAVGIPAGERSVARFVPHARQSQRLRGQQEPGLAMSSRAAGGVPGGQVPAQQILQESGKNVLFSRKFPPQTQSAQVWWRRTNIMLGVARQGARLMWWTAAPGGARDMRPFRLRWHGAEAAAQATLAFSGTARLRPPLMPRLRPCTQRGAGRRRPFAAERVHVNVDVLSTPNEDAVKMVPGCDVTGQVRSVSVRPQDLSRSDSGAETSEFSRLAARLLAIDGVKSLLFGFDFITVEKDSSADWDAIQVDFT